MLRSRIPLKLCVAILMLLLSGSSGSGSGVEHTSGAAEQNSWTHPMIEISEPRNSSIYFLKEGEMTSKSLLVKLQHRRKYRGSHQCATCRSMMHASLLDDLSEVNEWRFEQVTWCFNEDRVLVLRPLWAWVWEHTQERDPGHHVRIACDFMMYVHVCMYMCMCMCVCMYMCMCRCAFMFLYVFVCYMYT
jgi:hypothetical protein